MNPKMDFSEDIQLSTSLKLDNQGGNDKLLRGRRVGGLQAYFVALAISIALVYVVSKCAARIEEYSSWRVRRLSEKDEDSKDSNLDPTEAECVELRSGAASGGSSRWNWPFWQRTQPKSGFQKVGMEDPYEDDTEHATSGTGATASKRPAGVSTAPQEGQEGGSSGQRNSWSFPSLPFGAQRQGFQRVECKGCDDDDVPSASSGQRPTSSTSPLHTGASRQGSENAELGPSEDDAQAGPSTSAAHENSRTQPEGALDFQGKHGRRHQTLLRLGDVTSPHYLNLGGKPDWRRLKEDWGQGEVQRMLESFGTTAGSFCFPHEGMFKACLVATHSIPGGDEVTISARITELQSVNTPTLLRLGRFMSRGSCSHQHFQRDVTLVAEEMASICLEDAKKSIPMEEKTTHLHTVLERPSSVACTGKVLVEVFISQSTPGASAAVQ